jgi:hypothetical protein
MLAKQTNSYLPAPLSYGATKVKGFMRPLICVSCQCAITQFQLLVGRLFLVDFTEKCSIFVFKSSFYFYQEHLAGGQHS